LSRAPLFTPPFILCVVACFAHALAFHMYLHLPGFLAELGADAFTIGLLAGLAGVAAIVSRPPTGRIIDQRGRRRVILVGGALNMLALSLYLDIDSVGPLLYAVRILHGVSQAVLFAGFFTFAADIIPASRRTEGIGIYGVSGLLPIGLGPTLGDWILTRGDYHDLFLASIALALVSFLLSLALRDRRPASHADQTARNYFETVMDPVLMPLWFIGSIFAIATSAAFIFMKTFVLEIEAATLGDFFRSYSFAAIALRVLFGSLPDRVGPKRVFIPALVVLAVGLASLTFVEGTAGLVAAGILCGVGHGFGIPILNGLVITRARESELGAAIATCTALFDVGFLIGGPLFGTVIETSSYPAMFVASASILTLGLFVYWVWDRRY
jgi:MFS family permease